ncbi:hypothetical protein QYE76_069272 [Lolium multiflorum]|uniref:RNA-directed DNA polymerase n=1 Tax=Lolium multiflorum TaxID=4521 RepID=A0AAD8WER5_LOLMU|nr:hypothetical protein QYE76_069272 [Lolium multiflorum]
MPSPSSSSGTSSPIIIIISTIYTAITIAAPRHRCSNSAFMDTDKFRNMSATYGLDSQVVANLYKAFASHYELPKKNFDKYHEPYKDKVDSSVNKCVVIETVDNVIPEAYIEKTPFPAKMKEYSVISSAVNKSEKKPKEPEEQIKIEPAVAIVKDLVTENVEDGHIIFCEDASNIVSHPNKSKQVSVPMLSVRIGDHCYYGLCDIGASVSAIPYELYTEIMHEIGSCELEDIDVVIHLANRETISPIGIVRDVEVLCGKIKYPADFLVLGSAASDHCPIIFGRPFLNTCGAIIDCKKEKFLTRFAGEPYEFNFSKFTKTPYKADLPSNDFKMEQCASIVLVPNNPLQQHLENSESEAFRKERDELEEIFLRQPILKHDLPVEDLGTTPPPKEDPVFDLKPLPDNLKYAHIDDKKIYPVIISSKLSEIEEERWVSPVHCVPKKGGMTVVPNDNDELIPQRIVVGYRMCIDFRKVNKVTKKDHYPLPFIDQMLERLSKNTHFCFLDGYSGFSQIAVKAKDQEKTTFTCPYGTYAYRRMPFGLCNAPATFQRCMSAIFHGFCESIVERCEETNLILNWEKCHFMVNEGIVLGHKISERGIEVDRAKVEAIEKMPYPRDVKGIRSVLGHAGFYRRFIKDFSKISKPLTNLLQKDKALTTAPVVEPPDWNLPFEIMCDASDFVVGAVLGQRVDKKLNVIHYASKTLDAAQRNYATTEKELLAVVFACDKFRPYIVDSKVTIHTDHAAIRYLMTKKDAKPRLIRWVLLQEFDLHIIDRKGADNPVADNLSRLENIAYDPVPVNDSFPNEQLAVIKVSSRESPWICFGSRSIMSSSGTQKDSFFEDVVNPYMNELKMHPKELRLVDGELQIKDVQGPKGEGSLEDRMEKLEQEVFNYKKMAEREVDIFHKIVSELIDGHKKETAKLWDDIFSLHDTTNKLQAQLYDVHNQNCEYENRVTAASAGRRTPERKELSGGQESAGNSLPEGEIDAIAIVIERDIISIIIIIISTIYTAITTAAPHHRCSNSDVISRKSIGVKQLNRLQEEIVEILCELEIYFPPAFFDIMVHLLVHVVDDIIHLGPTFLHNMMPFERLNGVIKGFVRNRARPDGSIAKGFLTYECISFCQNYLSTENEDVGLPTRKHVGRLAGFGHREGYRAMHVGIAGRHADFDRAHRVALQHIELVSPWVDKHKSLIEQKFIDLGRPRKTGDVTKEHNSSFTGWFKKRLLESPAPMPSTEEQKLIFSLSQGPGHNVRTYQSYDINGYRFYTEEKDKNSEYQNSGVTMLSYTDDKTDVKERFYGRIEEIWELDYVGVTMPMFRVRWAKSVEKDGLYFTTMVIPDAKSKTPSAKNEPWVLASQVDQCFFITDPSKPSRVVVRRGKRSIIGMEGEADKQDIDKNGDPKIEEEFDKYFDKPTTYSKVRRKTTLPAKGCPYTRRNLKVAGLKYSTTAMKKGKNIVKKR